MITMNQITTAERVKDRRVAAGLSVREAAAKAGISPMTLYRIESGEVTPQMRTLRKIARALETSHGWLTGGKAA